MSAGLGPLDAGVVIARLRSNAPLLRTVGAAADYVAAYDRPGAPPAAFVVLAGEQVRVTQMAGAAIHTVVAEVDVAVMVRSYAAAARGGEQLDALVPVVAEVRAALNGWRPAVDGAEVVEEMQGAGRARVLRHSADVVWWVDRFSVTYRGRIG